MMTGANADGYSCDLLCDLLHLKLSVEYLVFKNTFTPTHTFVLTDERILTYVHFKN